MDAHEFARQLSRLHAFRSEYVGDQLLESLEEARLLVPRLRVRYPDPIARRFILIGWEDHRPRKLKLPIEPDGPRWDAAVDLSNALYRWQNFLVYGYTSNPLDDPEPRFLEFIQSPSDMAFVSWSEMRVDVSNDIEIRLFDNRNVDTFYTAWQLLLAADVADSGVHFRMNLAGEEGRLAWEAVGQGRTPPGARCSFHLLPVHTTRDFEKHGNALDAVVWFAEERSRAFSLIVKHHGGGRFRLRVCPGTLYGIAEPSEHEAD